MREPVDIRKKEVKLICGDKWRFSHRENGYIILEKYKLEKDKPRWVMQIHAVSMESALQYVEQNYNGQCVVSSYDELKDESNIGSVA